MIARASSGWQTMLADLSLILFMITAAKINEAPAKPNLAPPPTPPPLVLPALSQPVASQVVGISNMEQLHFAVEVARSIPMPEEAQLILPGLALA